MQKYYVYGHFIVGSDVPFYIGKGTGRRAWKTKDRNYLWESITTNNEYEVRILHDNLTEEQSLELETCLIEKYGRKETGGTLVNMTAGGEGISGYSHTPESKNKISKRNYGKKLTEEHKLAIGAANKGKIISDQEKNDRKERMLRLWETEEYKKKMSNKLKSWWTPDRKQSAKAKRTGVTLSEKTKEKISVRLTGKKMSTDTKEKIRRKNSGITHPMYGKPRSEETKRKMSETMKKKYLDKRNRL
jgi:hypothetical protein